MKEPVLLKKLEHRADTLKIAGFALLLLVSALFPYIAVGKYPSVEGWSTRHALLISVPMAVFLVAFGRLLRQGVFMPVAQRIVRIGAILLVLAFALLTCKTYLEWQVRWIKDSSFILNLRELKKEQIDKVNIIRVNDLYPVGNEFYRYYEYAVMFKMAWGEESRIGFHPSAVKDSEWVIKNVPLRRTMLKDFRPEGCRAMVTIRAKHPEVSRIQLVKAYLKNRWLKPAEMPAFLREVTILELTDYSCDNANASVLNQ